jgi:hypothetical protein
VLERNNGRSLRARHRIAGAGKTASYGPEIELTALLTPELTMTFSGNYTHAMLRSVNAAVTNQPRTIGGDIKYNF